MFNRNQLEQENYPGQVGLILYVNPYLHIDVLAYLRAWLVPPRVELEELPGATGLRALRFQLTLDQKDKDAISQEILLRDIEEGLRVH